LRLNPAAVSNQLVLGEVLFLAANPVKNAEGQRLLLPLALGHGAEQQFAATLLADQANLGLAERRQIAQALRDHGPTNATTRLLVAQLSLPVERPARDAALAQVVREFGGDDSLRAPLAAWFFRRGEAASALTILPLDRCITNPPWLHARLEALVRAGAWGELGTTLTRPNLPLSPLRQFAFTAQQFAGTGHPAEAAANFQQALQNAKPEPLVPDPLRWLANHAESAGLPATAAAAWEQRMRDPQVIVTSGREAVRLLTPLNEEVRLRSVLRQLNLTMPSDVSIATEFAWVSAMLNVESATARDLLRDARQRRPEVPDYRFGLALAELRLSHAAAALALVEESPADWDKLLPRSRLTYVAVLAANQQREAARKFARKLDPARLKNAERALLQEWVPAE
jgi:hypothetical protein